MIYNILKFASGNALRSLCLSLSAYLGINCIRMASQDLNTWIESRKCSRVFLEFGIRSSNLHPLNKSDIITLSPIRIICLDGFAFVAPSVIVMGYSTLAVAIDTNIGERNITLNRILMN